jgi:hypothetical protein
MPSTKKRNSTAECDRSLRSFEVEDLDRCRDAAVAFLSQFLLSLRAASCYFVVNDQVRVTAAPPTVPVKLTS